VRAGTELGVGVGEAQQLGDSQPGLHGGEQQRVVAPASPCRSGRRVDQRLRLDRREERDGAWAEEILALKVIARGLLDNP
jgi:hypothetical protein